MKVDYMEESKENKKAADKQDAKPGKTSRSSKKFGDENAQDSEDMQQDSDYDVDFEECDSMSSATADSESMENTEPSSKKNDAQKAAMRMRSKSVPDPNRRRSLSDRSTSLRSTRLSANPDFAAKHKRFLSSVSGAIDSNEDSSTNDSAGARAARSRDRSREGLRSRARSKEDAQSTTTETADVKDTSDVALRPSRSRSSVSSLHPESDSSAQSEKVSNAKRSRESEGENDDDMGSNVEESPQKKKRSLSKSSDAPPKPIAEGGDMYCWKCHRDGTAIVCKLCPRVFHLRCLHLEVAPPSDWVCPECSVIVYAENTETRSPAMKSLSLDQLCNLLKFTLARMKSYAGSEWFCKPVDVNEFPAYQKYVIRPMDLSHLEKNIKQKRYGSTHAFFADTQWILHNSVIFNTYQSKLTNIAKTLVKICKQELDEIETCPECYLNAHTRKDSWFIEVCRRPHTLVWAKLKGFPFWPAKAMKTNSENLVDVRFFGAHDRAWIPMKNVFLYSRLNPGASKNKRKNQFDDCIMEVEQHIKKLRDKFGEFVYPPFKCNFDAAKEEEQLGSMLPGYKAASRRHGRLLGPVRNFSTPSPQNSAVKKDASESPKRNSSSDKSKTPSTASSMKSARGSVSKDDEENVVSNEKTSKNEEVGSDADKEKILSSCSSSSVSSTSSSLSTVSSSSSLPTMDTDSSPTKVNVPETKKLNKNSNEESVDLEANKIEDKSVPEKLSSKRSLTPAGSQSKNESKTEQKNKDINDGDVESISVEPSSKCLRLDKPTSDRENPVKTDFVSSLKEKIQRLSSECDINVLESKNMETENTSSLKTVEVESKSNVESSNDTVSEISKDKDVLIPVKPCDKVVEQDKSVSIDLVSEDEKSEGDELQDGSNKQESSINNKCKIVVCDLKLLESKNSSINVENKGADEVPQSSKAVDKSSKVIDTISATIEEVVQESLLGSKKSEGKRLTDIVHTLNSSSEQDGSSGVKSSEVSILRSSLDVPMVEENVDMEHPRIVSILKARDALPGPEEIERVFSPNRRKGFPSKVRRSGSNGSSSSSDLSSVEELKRICADQESRLQVSNEPENQRKRPSTTPVEELVEESYGVLDEVSGQFLKKRPDRLTEENPDVTITLVSDDESSNKTTDKNQSKVFLPTVSLSKDVSLSIIREDGKNGKDLSTSLDMECVSDTEDPLSIDGKKQNEGALSTSIPLKPTARKSFPAASNIGIKTSLTKTNDGGCEMTRRMSSADIQAAMNQQNVVLSSPKVSPAPSPKTQQSGSFYTKISQIAANSPVSGGDEVQISNTMSLKIQSLDSAAAKSRPSPPPAIPIVSTTMINGNVQCLSVAVAPTTSTSTPTTRSSTQARVLPQLQLKPLTTTANSSLRGNYGPASGRMDSMSQRLAENMREMMENMLNEMATEGRPEAKLKQMQLELERAQWKHRNEMAEYLHNTDLIMMEMRASLEAEKHRAIMETRLKCQAEKEAAVNDTKMKQWCALCKKEALFYCCWNTAYCNYPCQQEHWPQHMANCAQTTRAQEPANGTKTSVKMMSPFAAVPKSGCYPPPTQSVPRCTTASNINSVAQVGHTYPGPKSKMNPQINQTQFIRQNLQVANSLMPNQDCNKVKPPHQQNGGIRMMRAPLMCRPPMGFAIRSPQYLISSRPPHPPPPGPPGFFQ